MLTDAFDAIRSLLGDPPFALMSDLDGDKKTEEATITKTTTKNIVLADGTYSSVTSTEIIGGGSNNSSDDAMPHLRKLVSTGDILLGTVACVCLTKMALKTDKEFNKLTLGTLPPIASSLALIRLILSAPLLSLLPPKNKIIPRRRRTIGAINTS